MSGFDISLIDHDIDKSEFDCGDTDINNWVTQSFYPTLTWQIKAYEVKREGHVIAYFALSVRKIMIQHCPDDLSEYFDVCIDKEIPSVCIQYIAIRKDLQHNGLGTLLLRYIIETIKSQKTIYPIRFIVIDAKLKLVHWYTRENFIKMGQNHDSQEGYTEYMYFDLMDDTGPIIKYAEDYIARMF